MGTARAQGDGRGGREVDLEPEDLVTPREAEERVDRRGRVGVLRVEQAIARVDELLIVEVEDADDRVTGELVGDERAEQLRVRQRRGRVVGQGHRRVVGQRECRGQECDPVRIG